MPGVHSASATHLTIRLGDGRTLGYAEYGHPAGQTLFYFHGHPSSRFEAGFLAEAAAQAGIRLIGVDRPGMGLSGYKARRRLLDWPDDVVELANQLQIDRFAVVGFSGGGPYAIACAHKISSRLIACGTVSGVGHLNPMLSFLAQWAPWLVLPITRRFFQDDTRAQESLTRFSGSWAEPDRRSLLQPGIKELLAASLVEGLRQGAKGAAYDGTVLGRYWGFELEDITLPAIYLWHGEQDNEIPITTARAVASSIPNCKAMYYPDEGHISLLVNHTVEIVKTLIP